VSLLRRWFVPLVAALSLSAPTGLAGAQSAAPSLDLLDAQALLEMTKAPPGARVPVSVRLSNRSSRPVGPIEVRVRPLALDPSAPYLKPTVLGPGETITHSFLLVAGAEGTFAVSVWLLDASGTVLLVRPAGALEVASSSILSPTSPVVIAALVTMVGTLLIQVIVWRLNRRQRTSETVAQMVVGMARDYFGTLSGTLVELTRTVRQVPGAVGAEREHLLVRAFFFFGVFLHKENQFAFDQGVMYLPHLWAEGAVSTIAARLLRLVPLTRQQEAVVHKCFSDIALMQRSTSAVKGVDFEFRTLYDFERMLQPDRSAYAPPEQRAIRAVFEDVKGRFENPDVVAGIQELEEALRVIIEYESTVLFEDVYVRRDQDRGLPVEAPKGFEAIVEGVPWKRVRAVVERAASAKTP
jgi:hypothetical protein